MPRTNPGRYVATIDSHALTEAGTGTVQIAIKIVVQGRVDPQNPDTLLPEGSGLEATIFRAISENSAPYIWDDLDQLGYTGEDFSQLDEAQAAEAGKEFISLAGKEVYVRMKTDFFQGKERERWDLDMRGGLNLKAAGNDKVREANARFGRKAVKGGSGTGRKTATVAADGDMPQF